MKGRTMRMLQLLVVCLGAVFGTAASCVQPPPSEPEAGVVDSGRPVIGRDCGDPTSTGNALGIGKHCESTNDCPVVDEGTTIQCSTVLTDDSLPLLCSRICGATDGGQIDCGPGATCMNIIELGYDLDVCVPFTCDPLFDGGVPRDGGSG